MKYIKNNEAVSPVIGVILMVAITVILAAVIAAFVFGMVGSFSSSKQVAIAVSEIYDSASDQYTTTLTYQGGKDYSQVSALTATITIPGSPADDGFIWTYPAMGTAPVPVGTVGTIVLGSLNKDQVIVIATFTDGSQQVILDTFV